MPLMILDTAEYLYISLFDKKYQVMISAQKPCIDLYLCVPIINLKTGVIGYIVIPRRNLFIKYIRLL